MYRIITHTDLDGSSCVIVAKHFFKNNIYVSHDDYNSISDTVDQVIEEADQYEHIFFTDICPEEIDVIKLSKLDNVTILDHHVTREYMDEVYDHVIVDISMCGGKLFYHHLIDKWEKEQSPLLEEFLELVDTFDRWVTDDIKKKENADDLNRLFDFYGGDYFENVRILQPGLSREEEYILNVIKHREKIFIKQQLKKIQPLQVKNYIFALSFITRTQSSSGLSDAIKMAGIYDGLILPNVEGDSVSMYSSRVDVSKICKNLGGGGHKSAAGFSYKFKDQIKAMLKDVLNKGIK